MNKILYAVKNQEGKYYPVIGNIWTNDLSRAWLTRNKPIASDPEQIVELTISERVVE